MGRYHPKISNGQDDKPVLTCVLKSKKECITNAINNPNGKYKSTEIKKAEVIQRGMKIGHLVILKCGTRHRGYPGKGIMEGDCTHYPEDWNDKSIK